MEWPAVRHNAIRRNQNATNKFDIYRKKYVIDILTKFGQKNFKLANQITIFKIENPTATTSNRCNYLSHKIF